MKKDLEQIKYTLSLISREELESLAFNLMLDVIKLNNDIKLYNQELQVIEDMLDIVFTKDEDYGIVNKNGMLH